MRLGVSIAYRISVWNIGAEGQFLAGAMAATAITIYFPHLPMYLSIPCMVVASIAAGTLGAVDGDSEDLFSSQ